MVECKNQVLTGIIICIPLLCIGFMVTLLIVVALNVKPVMPECYIQDFYVHALDTTNPTTNDTTIDIDLMFHYDSIASYDDVHYATINLTLFFYNISSSGTGLLDDHSIANYTIPEFYQNIGAYTSFRRLRMNALSGLPWKEALHAVSNGSSVRFRVMLATRVKFLYRSRYSKSYSFVVRGDVAVDGSGTKVYKGDIKLN